MFRRFNTQLFFVNTFATTTPQNINTVAKNENKTVVIIERSKADIQYVSLDLVLATFIETVADCMLILTVKCLRLDVGIDLCGLRMNGPLCYFPYWTAVDRGYCTIKSC